MATGATAVRFLLLPIAFVALLLADGGKPAAAAPVPAPGVGTLVFNLSSVQAGGAPDYADPFHDLNNHCRIPNTPGSYIMMDKDGVLTGYCGYSDSYSNITETRTGSLAGTVDLETGDVEFSYDTTVRYAQSGGSTYTYSINFNADGVVNTGYQGTANSASFSFSKSCSNSDPNACGNDSDSYSYGGTIEFGLDIKALAEVDLSIDHIEVVQVVQTAGNDMRLVAGKATVARVFVKGTLPIDDVKLTLKGKRGGSDLGEPILINGSATGASPAVDRAAKTGSFNYRLPADWTHVGSIELEAEVKPPEGVADPEENNNKKATGATFYERRRLNIAYLPVCYQPPGQAAPACPDQVIATGSLLLNKLFPLPDTGAIYGPVNVPNWIWTQPLTADNQRTIIAALRKRYDLMQQLSGGSVADQLAGWLPPIPDILAGLSDPIWNGSTGRVSFNQMTDDLGDSQHTLAHEVAHNLGLRHPNKPDSCNAKDNKTDWPYADSTVQEYGWDMALNQVVAKTKRDLMTYCTPPVENIWMSPHSYDKLFQGNFQPAALGGVTAAGQAAYLVISGSAMADGTGGTLDPAYTVTSSQAPPPSDPDGSHCLRFGPTVVDYCFTLEFKDHRTQEPEPEEWFSLVVPLPAGATSVALMAGATELARLDASPSAPSLDVAAPNGDWTAGTHTLTWSGSDADGDDVLYTVLYSPDGGASWVPIEVDTPASEFSFDVASLEPSQQGMFRVLASDGLKTTEETTPPVKVGASEASIDLVAGWNLISLPVVPEDPASAMVLASIAGKFNSAWAYQAAGAQAGAQTDGRMAGAAAATWLSYDPAVPPFLNTLTAIDVTMGVWVNMKEAATLTVTGTPPGTTEIAIAQGWNFIGYPSGQTKPVADVLSGLTYNSAWAYDPSLSPSPWQSYDPNVPPFLNTLQNFTPGRGYALNAPGPGTVTVQP
ncbi:MAG: hypothetical protein HYY03_02230 [Chloroflexi bacterium]|nr:hypothetical protein [Chloroflexota bacterium]